MILTLSLVLIPQALCYFGEGGGFLSIRGMLKDVFRSANPLDLFFPPYSFLYYLGDIKPVSFLVPTLLWVVAFVSNIVRFIMRDNSSETVASPEE